MALRAFGRLVGMGLRGRRMLGTVLFVVVVAIASAGIVTGLEGRHSAARQWDAAFDRAKAPHAIFRAFTAAQLPDLDRDPRVVASAIISQRDLDLLRADGSRESAVLRAPSGTAAPTVGGPHLVGGRLPVAATEVALERSFADDLGVRLGAAVDLVATDGTTVGYRVVGTVLDFEDCFFPQCDPGVAWTTAAGMDRAGGPAASALLARLADPANAAVFAGEVLAADPTQLVGTQDWLDTRGDALAVNEFFGAFLAAFGLFVLVAAGVVVAGSVTNRVLARRREVGMLKAIGATPRQLIWAITVEHLVLCAVSLVIGWVLAVALAPRLRLGVAAVLGSPERRLALGSLAFAALALAAIVVVATAAPLARLGRLTTAAALQPAETGGHGSAVAGAAAALGAGPSVTSGLKDTTSRPLRTVLAVSSILLAIVALVVTLGLNRTVSHVSARSELTGDPWDVSIARHDTSPARIEAVLGSAAGVAAWSFDSEDRRVIDGGGVALVRAVGGDPSSAGYVVQQGRSMRAAGEAMAGYGFLQRFGKRIGSVVGVDLNGTPIEVTIVGRYAETEDSGEVLLVRWETISALQPAAAPDVYRVVARSGTDRAALAADLASALGPGVAVAPTTVDTAGFDAFEVAFWLVALLVLAVALANVGATILLGVHERRRELGVLRSIGFTPGQLVVATAASTAVLAVLAALIGVPVGLWVNATMLHAIGKAMGYGPELGVGPSAVAMIGAVAAVAVATVAIGASTCVATVRRTASDLVRYE